MGLTRGTNRAHLCRAVLESIALQSADLVEAMLKDSAIPLRELRVDGGASQSGPLMQMQADLLGCDVVRPRETETTALGAAYLAGLGVGLWSSPEEIKAQWRVDRTFRRERPVEDAARLRRDWQKAIQRARAWEESAQ